MLLLRTIAGLSRSPSMRAKDRDGRSGDDQTTGVEMLADDPEQARLGGGVERGGRLSSRSAGVRAGGRRRGWRWLAERIGGGGIDHGEAGPTASRIGVVGDAEEIAPEGDFRRPRAGS